MSAPIPPVNQRRSAAAILQQCGIWHRSGSTISVAEPAARLLSGQIAATPGSGEVPKDLAGQAKLATASLAAALKELGGVCARHCHAARLRRECRPAKRSGRLSPLYVGYSGTRCPASQTIGVQALYKPEIKVQIEMVVPSSLEEDNLLVALEALICSPLFSKFQQNPRFERHCSTRFRKSMTRSRTRCERQLKGCRLHGATCPFRI